MGLVVQLDGFERVAGGSRRVGDAGERGAPADEFHRRHLVVDRFVLRYETDLPEDTVIGAGGAAHHRHRAGGGSHQSDDDPQHRGLSRTVGPEQSGDTRSEGTADLGDRHLLAEPFREVVDDHGGLVDEHGAEGGHASLRYRHTTVTTAITARTAMAASDTPGPNPACSGMWSIVSRSKIQSRT